ncbi:MAG: two-component regulator propeller domain-containing protein, partial [Acidobacteriota bacterium]
MPHIACRVTGLCLLGLFGLGAALTADRLPFRHYQTEDGLPQSQVLALLEDSRGELWVGTWSGAARFDGVRFHFLGLRSGLPSSFVFDLVEDAAGDLWIAAGSGLAHLAAGQRQEVTTVAYPLFPAPDASSVRDLFIDRNGILWAAALLGGVAYLSGGEPIRIRTPEIDNDAQQVFAETAGGELVVSTLQGLFTLDGESSRRWRSAPGPWNEPTTMVAALPDDTLLFATRDRLWRWHGDRAVEIRHRGEAIGLGRSAMVDRQDKLWITTGAGLYRQLPGEDVVRLGRAQGLRHEERFYTLLEDRESNVWFGSDAGLTLFPGDLFRIFLPQDGLTNPSVWSIGLDADGSLLAGTSGGVYRFDGRRFTVLPNSAPLHDQMIRAIVADPEGRLWIGTRNNGLFVRHGQTWRHFVPPEFPAQRIYGMLCDSAGAVWIATRRGLARFAGDELDFWDHRHGLPDDVVLRVGEDPSGHIVAATAEGMVRLEHGRFVEPPEFAELDGVAVRAFVYGRDGTLWVGTDGRGLYRRSGDAWEVLHANEQAGGGQSAPSNDFTWGLIEDAQGRIWVATNRGLDLFTGERWINFSKRDGLIEDEIAAFAALA